MIGELRSSLAARIVAAMIGFSFIILFLLMTALYLFGVRQPISQIERRVDAEATQLVEIDRRHGQDALLAALQQRQDVVAREKAFGALISANGIAIAGNFPSWPATHRGDWVRIEADLYRDGDEDDHESITRDLMLSGGRRLLVGRDIEIYADRQELMVEAVVWGSMGALLFGLIGGALISRISSRRLEKIAKTARAVRGGDLSVRVPVRGSGDDFDQLGLTLNSMLDRNQALVESLARVSDNVAHELRTPLARLHSMIEQLAGAGDGPPETGLVSATMEEMRRIDATFDALLRAARLETRRHQLRREPVAFDQLVGDAIEYYSPEAEAREQSVSQELEHCTVDGDRDLLFQLVANLLDNAVKFAPTGGSIRVELAGAPMQVELRVQDSGPGVAEELRPQLTERFFRAPETQGVRGIGLGLTLANAIVDAHGGAIFFEGGPGEFTVGIRLPRGEPGLSDGS